MTEKDRARQWEVGRGWVLVAGLGSLPLSQAEAADVTVAAGGGRSLTAVICLFNMEKPPPPFVPELR